MSSDAPQALEAGFPDPAQQAEALLEVCQGDVHEAQAIVGTNLKFATEEAERRYWCSVEALLSKQSLRSGVKDL